MPESQTAADERDLIERLMDEESEVAEDPTQNALLSTTQTARTAPTPVDSGEQDEETPLQTLQDGPRSDLEPEDESDYIQLPEAFTDDPMGPGEDMVDATVLEPVQMPVGQRSDPSWDDALADMMEQANQTFQGISLEPPGDNETEGEMNWQAALSDRGNTE